MTTEQVLVVGGRGRVGRGVVADLLAHTQAQVTITGRSLELERDLHSYPADRVRFLKLDLTEQEKLQTAIASHNLVIHCAGPFRYRDVGVLRSCIDQGVNYLDVSDDRDFTLNALGYREVAEAAGITAVINSGVFPGISNSMVLQGQQQVDQPTEIHLNYVVAGSGGAAVTALQTTFLSLQHPFKVWLKGQWEEVKPYTGRKVVEFPPPFGRAGVYWFDLPESLTLAESFPVQTVAVKFGSTPDLYNRLTWMVAHWFPGALLKSPPFVKGLSHISYTMTSVTDRFSGTGIGIRAEVWGQKDGESTRHISTFSHPDAAQATGLGAGSIAQFILSGQLVKPGVWSVEQSLPTPLFQQAMQQRNITIQQKWL
jgi:saccharopine dehydrogenase-like NADP-dependent oxidoreductase